MEYQRASPAMAFSEKLRNGHSFNGNRIIYDGVFGGGQTKLGGPRVEDYAEIFGGRSGGSPIPVLDVPELNERKFKVEVSSSRLDYPNIFGGFEDFDFAVSHEEFLTNPIKDKKTPAKTRSYSEGSFSYLPSNPVKNQVSSNDQTSHGSDNGVKQFKMSYNKGNPGSKNGTNGTTLVTQLHAVPGYTCLIDEKITPAKDKPVPSSLNKTYQTNNHREGIMEGKKPASSVPSNGVSKQASKGANELHGESRSNGYDFNDVLFGPNNVGRGTPLSQVKRASTMSYSTGGNKCDSLKFKESRSYSLDGEAGVSSPPYFEDEVDINSVASTSAAALMKAIEEAQARLKIAKELMERRKGGHAGRVKPSFSGNLKAEQKKKGKDTCNQNNFGEDKVEETCEKGDASVQNFAGVTKQYVMKDGQVAAESEDRDKSSIAREAAEGRCAKNSVESLADCRQEEVDKREAGKEEDKEKDLMHPVNEDGEEKKIIENPEKCDEKSGVIEEATQQEAKEGDKEKDLNHSVNEYEGEVKKIIENPEQCGEKSGVIEEATEQDHERELHAPEELPDKEECLHKLKPNEEFHRKEDETKLGSFEQLEGTEDKVHVELEASERKLEHPENLTEDERKVDILELNKNDNLETLIVALEGVDMEGKHKRVLKQENGFASRDVFEKEEDVILLQDFSTQKELEKLHEEACEITEAEENKEAYGPEANNELKEDAGEREDNEQISDIVDSEHDNCYYKDGREKRLEENDDLMGNDEFMEAEEDGDLLNDAQTEAVEERQKEAFERVGTEEMQNLTDQKADETTEAREDALECCQDFDLANDVCNDNEINCMRENVETSINEDSFEMNPELSVNEDDRGFAEGKAYNECKETRRDSEAVEVANDLEENMVFGKVDDLAENNFKLGEINQPKENTMEAFDIDRHGINIDTAGSTFEQNQYEQQAEESEITSIMEEHVEKLACEFEDLRETDFGLKQEENKYDFEYSDEGRLVDSQLHCEFGEKHETAEMAHETETRQSTEDNEENDLKTPPKDEKEIISSQEEVKVEQQRKVDDAKERESEREKERIAVERAIREARERAFAEARERAAAGRTNVRVKGEAQGESAKPSVEANGKTIMEAKLKAERAAVERATAEARQRALEKALSENASFGARKQAEKYSDSKQSFQSYDSHYKGTYPPATSRYPNSSNQNASKSSEGGATGESAQRCKARMERHQRVAERATKALAEKNKRDLLAQKEQAERNRLAETLDAEVKRWASGKQGNLRALLSTLQYILGPDSGWQPVPLTDIIAPAAVKKAYRKATLCVHPDKLQQRGASVQQKYSCEKVFDLLKEACNKFSAEER